MSRAMRLDAAIESKLKELGYGGEWRILAAEDFCASVRDGTHDSPKPVTHGRPLITSRHIIGGRLDIGNAYLISQEDFDAINKRSKVDRWDVLISMIGTVGEPFLVRGEPDFAIKNIGLFKCKGEAEGKWLYYYLRSNHAQQLIREQARGTTQQYIPLGALRSFPIPVPRHPDELRAIAHILGTLDDKIELNRKQNETLEAIARALFKAWFVDFEPVRAKIEGRWQRGQSLPGLPAHLYDLFPDRLVESELGEIPEGWAVAPLRELASTISKGTTPTKDALQKASDIATTYFLKVRDITEGGEIVRNSLELIPASVHESVLKRSILRTDDLLFSIAGTIGRVGLVDEDLNNSNCNQAIAFVRLKDNATFQSLCWFTLRSKRTQAFVESKIVQGVQANASLATIGDIPVLVPTDRVLPAWNEFVRPLTQKLKANQSQSRKVTQLRDTLLPKLISGELRVPDAETYMERLI